MEELEDQDGAKGAGQSAALTFGVERLGKYAADSLGFVVFFLPSLMVSIVSFQAKLDGHRLMLESIRSFDVRAAACALDSDRLQIEAQVCELFDGLEEPLVAC